MLLDYTTCLGSHHSLWQVALLYPCRAATALLLECVPLTTE